MKPDGTGGLEAGWVGETSARPETGTPRIEQVAAPTGELYANPAATMWMLDDAGFDLIQWLMNEIEGKFASMEGDAFINGSGTNQPKGFLTYDTSAAPDATRPFGTLKAMTAGSATTVTTDELIDLTVDLRGPYRRGAVWLMNSATSAHIRKLKDTNGNYLWQPSLQAGQPAMLHGYQGCTLTKACPTWPQG